MNTNSSDKNMLVLGAWNNYLSTPFGSQNKCLILECVKTVSSVQIPRIGTEGGWTDQLTDTKDTRVNIRVGWHYNLYLTFKLLDFNDFYTKILPPRLQATP